jgi:TIR domain
MSGVFLSYSHHDESIASAWRQELTRAGVPVAGPDFVRVGGNIAQSISDALDDADAFVLLLSRPYLQSEWGKLEMASALASAEQSERRVILPVVVDADLDPYRELPPLLLRYQWLDARADGTSPRNVAQVVDALKTGTGSPTFEEELSAEERLLSSRKWLLALETETSNRERAEETRSITRMLVVGVMAGVLATAAAFLLGHGSTSASVLTNVITAAFVSASIGTASARAFELRTKKKRND